MKRTLLLTLLLAAALVGLPVAVSAGDDGPPVVLECDSASFPVSIVGVTVTIGPYDSQDEASAAYYANTDTLIATEAEVFPHHACAGCPGEQVGCFGGAIQIGDEAPEATAKLRQGADGKWFVDVTFIKGKLSFRCTECYDVAE